MKQEARFHRKRCYLGRLLQCVFELVCSLACSCLQLVVATRVGVHHFSNLLGVVVCEQLGQRASGLGESVEERLLVADHLLQTSHLLLLFFDLVSIERRCALQLGNVILDVCEPRVEVGVRRVEVLAQRKCLLQRSQTLGRHL